MTKREGDWEGGSVLCIRDTRTKLAENEKKGPKLKAPHWKIIIPYLGVEWGGRRTCATVSIRSVRANRTVPFGAIMFGSASGPTFHPDGQLVWARLQEQCPWIVSVMNSRWTTIVAQLTRTMLLPIRMIPAVLPPRRRWDTSGSIAYRHLAIPFTIFCTTIRPVPMILPSPSNLNSIRSIVLRRVNHLLHLTTTTMDYF